MANCGTGVATSLWVRLWDAEWRAVLLLLRLGGRNSSSGWPPTSSQRWAAYSYVVLVASCAMNGLYLFELLDGRSSYAFESKYLFMLYMTDAVFKSLGAAASQVMTIRRRSEMALVVHGIAKYTSSCSPTLILWRGKVLVLGMFILSTVLIPALQIFFVITSMDKALAFELTTMVFGIMLPSIFLVLVDNVFVGVLAASVFLAAGVADDVQDHMSALARHAPMPQGSALPPSVVEVRYLHIARSRAPDRLRELRVRQQRLHDVIVAANAAFSGVNLCSLLVTGVEACLCLYSDISDLRGRGTIDAANSTASRLLTLLWSGNLLMRFLATFILGQWLCNNHTRISNALHVFLASSRIPPDETKQEMRGFLHQIQMQDNRSGVFGVFYFDLKTMKTVVASFATFVVVITQFDSD